MTRASARRPEASTCDPHTVERRSVVLGLAAALTTLGARAAAAQDARARRPAAGDRLVRVGDAASVPLTPADIVIGAAPVMAWPMTAGESARSASRLNRILLVRLAPEGLSAKTSAAAAEGIVAYSAICTHTGCEVGTFLAAEQQLYCECHQSRFDPRDQARVIDGPAPRNLPSLPLRVEEGRLVVAAPFTTRPGFEQG